ncbi:MAG TPA: xanthan lyase, partial [Bacteroidales bacterium]|nr:xanthan lyase [Bacteroidales bacterium]
MRIQKVVFLVFLVCFFINDSDAQDRIFRLERLAGKRSDFVPEMFAQWNHTGGVKIDSIRVNKDSLRIDFYFNPSTSHIPVRSDWVNELRNRLKQNLGSRFRKYAINLRLRGRAIDEFIPNVFRDSTLKADEKRYSVRFEGVPLVTRPNQNYAKGLTGNHIALWPSHGYFFDQQLDRWQWQRARLWQTVEDIFPWTFTSSYLVPMLENAGANVLLPRERDTQVNEVIVDNDLIKPSGQMIYESNEWYPSPYGFRWSDTLFSWQNPFLEGTSLSAEIATTDSLKVLYVPDIPETGYYAVYISYQKTPECIRKVPYLVNHTGGNEKFFVNQCMGYGTWVYLGTFHFLKGINYDSGSVSINVTGIKGILSTDAVRFGGGMGNVARRPGTMLIPRQRSANDGKETLIALLADSIPYHWKTSGKPRWMEGSRYYLQYSGMPDTLTYNLNDGKNDYNDDYMSRPEWVNYLVGPSKSQYSDKYSGGLNIPVDLSLAFHTDAGITENDSIIGTLGIYSTVRNDGFFPDGRSKMASRDLTDIVQTQIVADIRSLMNPKWTRRGLWDREYSEAWRPVVPSMLLELLSHQNLADMKFGLDPRFKFIAARAVYKGLLRYLASEQHRDVAVQPLPPDHMAIERIASKNIRLSWLPVSDPLEATAVPEGYMVYMKTGDNGFASPVYTKDNYLVIELPEWSTIYSFHVTAINSGGESMPGETLSVCLSPGNDPLLIVNAFDRICA